MHIAFQDANQKFGPITTQVDDFLRHYILCRWCINDNGNNNIDDGNDDDDNIDDGNDDDNDNDDNNDNDNEIKI